MHLLLNCSQASPHFLLFEYFYHIYNEATSITYM